jgi:hypothetical protein
MSIYKYFDGHLTVILQVIDGTFMDDYPHFNLIKMKSILNYSLFFVFIRTKFIHQNPIFLIHVMNI